MKPMRMRRQAGQKNFYGDLGNMLYPSTQQPEYNFDFDINQTYSYVTPTKSVEEAMIATQNDKATGNLFMYRDSFGNALLPYFANAYNSAYFTKAFPINLSLEVMSRNSDTVVLKLQREISFGLHRIRRFFLQESLRFRKIQRL